MAKGNLLPAIAVKFVKLTAMNNKMSLTEQQKEELNKLSLYFEKLEKLAAKNNIDLDVFISEYKDDGYSFYQTEKIEMLKKAEKRKKVFEKTVNVKAEKSSSSR
jgi:hypothetical protein